MKAPEIDTIDQYFERYGSLFVAKSTALLDPLYLPGKDALPDTSEFMRQPYEPQACVVEAAKRMLDMNGNGMIVGQMGVGKTCIGSMLVHLHANRSRRSGGLRGRYRAIILCPDHLLGKWREEIEITVPGAKVFTLDNEGVGHKQLIRDLLKIREGTRGAGKHKWKLPDGPEWYIIGRNQNKFLPDDQKLGERHEYGFNGEIYERGSSRPARRPHSKVPGGAPEGSREASEGDGSDGDGRRVHYHCPKCGSRINDTNGEPIDVPSNKKLLSCSARYAVELRGDELTCGRDIKQPFMDHREGIKFDHHKGMLLPSHKNLPEGHMFEQEGKKWVIRICGDRLWQFNHRKKRWPPAEFISTQMRGAFHYLIVDECFPGETMISTPKGLRPIMNIRPGDKVTTVDNKGDLVTRRVLRLVVKRQSQPLVTIIHDRGELSCTPAHEIYTYGGYEIEAGKLVSGDRLVYLEDSGDGSQVPGKPELPELRQGVRGHDTQSVQKVVLSTVRLTKAGRNSEKAVPAVWSGIYERPKQGSRLLFAELLRAVSNARSRVSQEDGAALESKVRSQHSGDQRTHEEDEQGPRISGSPSGSIEGEALFWGQRWKRVYFSSGSDSDCGFARLRAGISPEDGEPVVEVLSHRLGEAEPEDSDRSRWAFPFSQDPEGSRLEKGGDSQGTWMECAPISQRGDRQGSADSDSGDQGSREFLVYDLEIEEFHKYFANGVLVSNCHEAKSSTAARANAAGKLMASIPHVIGMTGTLIGGYASHLFPFLWRLAPRKLVDLGFEWGKVMPFLEEYGRIERTITTRTTADGKVTTNRTSLRRDGSDDSAGGTQKAAPGVMPALFGHLLLDKAIFLSLSEMSDNLPGMTEYVPGLQREDLEDDEDKKFWVECRVDMEPEQKEEYQRIESELVATCHELLANGSMKLLGAMLHTLLGYSDRPWDWDYPDEIRVEAHRFYAEHPDKRRQPTVGYWGEKKVFSQWTGVVTPRNLDQDVIYPKEKTLIDICLREREAGNQTWVFCQMTDKRDVQPRIKSLLEAHGMRVNILRPKAVKTRDRLTWINKMGPRSDVIISHPQPVETGIDFFSKDGGHNFNAICFYETGYNVLTIRQAAARAWRLAQWKDCRVYYLMYAGTAQESAMKLVARKMAASKELDGDLSVEGLGSMVDSSSEAMALARAIERKIDDVDIHRSWSKIGGNQNGRARPVRGLDLLPMEVQIAVDVMAQPKYGLSFEGVDWGALQAQFADLVQEARQLEF